MAVKKKQPAATRRRIACLRRELARVERQIASLQIRPEDEARFDGLKERQEVLFIRTRSNHMH